MLIPYSHSVTRLKQQIGFANASLDLAVLKGFRQHAVWPVNDLSQKGNCLSRGRLMTFTTETRKWLSGFDSE
jgi:hypothetical protein